MFFKKHKANRKYGTNFVPQINTPPPDAPPPQQPTRIVKDGGTRICHCEPQKNKPNAPRSQYGTNLIPPTVNMLRIITKDEFILRELKKCKAKRQDEIWETNSKGYNFCFLGANGEYYSVDYINKLLER